MFTLTTATTTTIAAVAVATKITKARLCNFKACKNFALPHFLILVIGKRLILISLFFSFYKPVGVILKASVSQILNALLIFILFIYFFAIIQKVYPIVEQILIARVFTSI